ncbi:MAG: NeuD/PglB/VioB family sugar acetyltransferase [bacterium]
MIKKIAVYGAGGFGREVALLIKRINSKDSVWDFIGFFDDDISKKGSRNEYGNILGNIEDLNAFDSQLSVVIAVGKPRILKLIKDKITNENIDFPNLIAPEAMIFDIDNFTIGEGNILCSFSSFSCNVRIGDFNVFNNRVSLGHDATIGSYNSFMTAVRISGDTNVHEFNFFGVNSVLLPGIRVGNNTTIGAGSVVIRKTMDNMVYIGNPAKKFKF